MSVKAVMTELADAIREKTGGAEPLTIAQMAQEVRALETGGGVELPELDNPGGSGQLVEGYQMLDENGNVVDGAIPVRGFDDLEETESDRDKSWYIPEGFYPEGMGWTMLRFFASPPAITVTESGKILATSSVSKGYYSGGTETATKQLDIQYGQTITPGTEDVEIPAQKFTVGTQVIKGDVNLMAENIVSGVSIFGVEGNAQTGVALPSLSNPAGAAELFSGKQLIDANGNVVDGSFTIDNELSQQDSLIEQIKSALSGKASGAVVLQDKTVTPSYVNQFITADEGYGGLGTVKVLGMDEDLIIPRGTLDITENGKHDVEEYKYVNVNVESSGGGDKTLPDGYFRCSYIQFTGKECLDTGLKGNQDTKIRVVFTRETSSAKYLFGAASGGNTASITAYLSSGGSWRFGSKSVSKTIAVDENLIQTAIVDKTGIDLAFSTGNISGVTAFETPYTLILGGCRYATGGFSAQHEGKVVLWEIYAGTTLIQQWVPVGNADGTYRFYDQVTGNFFDSIGDEPLKGGNW